MSCWLYSWVTLAVVVLIAQQHRWWCCCVGQAACLTSAGTKLKQKSLHTRMFGYSSASQLDLDSLVLFSHCAELKVRRRTWFFIAYSDERWSCYQFFLHHLSISLWKGGRMYFLNLGVKGLKLFSDRHVLNTGFLADWDVFILKRRPVVSICAVEQAFGYSVPRFLIVLCFLSFSCTGQTVLHPGQTVLCLGPAGWDFLRRVATTSDGSRCWKEPAPLTSRQSIKKWSVQRTDG